MVPEYSPVPVLLHGKERIHTTALMLQNNAIVLVLPPEGKANGSSGVNILAPDSGFWRFPYPSGVSLSPLRGTAIFTYIFPVSKGFPGIQS